MNYTTGQMMQFGDEVTADGMAGVIVCDFDNRKFADGCSAWDIPEVKLVGGYTLSAGVMVKTVEAGLIHYDEGLGSSSLSAPTMCRRTKQASAIHRGCVKMSNATNHVGWISLAAATGVIGRQIIQP